MQRFMLLSILDNLIKSGKNCGCRLSYREQAPRDVFQIIVYVGPRVGSLSPMLVPLPVDLSIAPFPSSRNFKGAYAIS